MPRAKNLTLPAGETAKPAVKKTAIKKPVAAAAPKRGNKFNSVPTVVDGLRFDSKREAARWGELKLLERAGKITGLSRQVPFALRINNQLICTYRADFQYHEGGKIVVEDLKGVVTDVFRLKSRLMKVLLGIDVRITK